MKEAITEILKALNLLEGFEANDHYSAKITNKPYMPLCIEKHGSRVTVTHYFEQGGDLIADPDMEFEVVDQEWLPVAIQHANGLYFRAIDYRSGQRKVHPAQMKDQQEFARIWARNLLQQGFAKGVVERAE